MATKHEIYKWTLYYDGEGMSNGKTAIAYDIPNCLAAVANSIASTIPFFSTDFEHTTGSFQDPIKTIAEKYLPGIGESTTDNKAAVGTDARCAYVVPKRLIDGMNMALINGVTLNGGTYEKDGEEYEYQTTSVTLKVLTGSEATHTYDTNQAVCLVDLCFDVEYEDTQIERYFYVGNSSAEATSSTCTYGSTINSADTTQHNVYYVTNLSSSDVQSLTFATGGASGMFDSVVFDHATNRIIFTCSSNSGSQRTGYIYVKNGSTTIATITVNQAAAATYTLTAYTGTSGTATAASISYGSTTVPIRIQSNQAWTATSSQSWATLDTSTGNGDTQINVSVGSNAGSTSSRSANITITAAHGETCTISISQAGYNPGPGPSYTYTLVVEWEDDDYQAYPGEHLTAKAYIYRNGVEYTEVTNECSWTSDNTSIATVNNSSNKGDVTAVSAGNTDINASYNGTYGNFTESLYVEVIAVPTYDISVSPTSLTGLSTAQTSQSVTVTTTNQGWGVKSQPEWITSIYPQSSSYAGSDSVSFYVQQNTGGVRDGYIVFSGTVSGEASVYVQQTGSSTIFFNVYIDDGSSGSTTSVTINDTVNCVALFGPGAQDVTTSATWELDDPNMGSISSSGVFTPSKSGTVKITASYQGYHSNNFIRVNVSEEIVVSYELVVTPSYQTLESGTTTVVSYTATLYTYENGTQTNSENVTTSVYTSWSLSSTTYCSVGNTGSNKGKVTLTSNPPSDTSTSVTARYRNISRGIDESGTATVYIDHYVPPIYIKVNDDKEDISYNATTASSYMDVTVYGVNEGWSAAISAGDSGWLSINRSTGSSNTEYTVRISWTSNSDGDRDGTVTFTGLVEQDKITVYISQDGVDPVYIKVNDDKEDISYNPTTASGYMDVTVYGIGEGWSAAISDGDSGWLSVSATGGTPNASYSVTISWQTNSGDEREGTVTFTGLVEHDEITVTITQDGVPLVYSLEVTADEHTISAGTTTQCYATYVGKNGNTVVTSEDVTDDATWTITAGSSYGSIGNSSNNKGEFTGVSEGSCTVKATYGAVTGNTTISVIPAYEPEITYGLEVIPGSYSITRTGSTTCTLYYITYEDGDEVNREPIPNNNPNITWGPSYTYVTMNKGTITASNDTYDTKEYTFYAIYSGMDASNTITIGSLPAKNATITISPALFENDSNHGSEDVTINSMDCTISCSVEDVNGRQIDEEKVVVYATYNGSLAAATNTTYPNGSNWTIEDGSLTFTRRVANSSNSKITISVDFDRIDTDGGGGSGISGSVTETLFSYQSSKTISLPLITWQNTNT